MIVCGIDASSSMTGIGIFKGLDLVYYDKIPPKSKDGTWEENVCEIIEQITPLLKKYKVDKIYMENVPTFQRKGSRGGLMLKTPIVLGGVHMAFYYCFKYQLGYEIEFIDVNEWRAELGFLNGKRQREDMKEKAVDFVNKKFNKNFYFVKNSKSKKQDDDICEAICIAWSQIKPKERGFGRR